MTETLFNTVHSRLKYFNIFIFPKGHIIAFFVLGRFKQENYPQNPQKRKKFTAAWNMRTICYEATLPYPAQPRLSKSGDIQLSLPGTQWML